MNTSEGPPVEQPATFEFTPENLARARVHIAKYPPGRQQSAVLPLFDLAQRQLGGWLPRAAMDYVADMLEMPRIRAYEVATFYTMFNLRPVGRYLLQACTTTPCWLRGSDAVVAACERKLGIEVGGSTADGLFTLIEVECLGACVNAPILQVNDDFYEDLDGPSTERLLDAFREGKPPPPGSAIGRQTSAPIGGPATLTELTETGAAPTGTATVKPERRPIGPDHRPGRAASGHGRWRRGRPSARLAWLPDVDGIGDAVESPEPLAGAVGVQGEPAVGSIAVCGAEDDRAVG